MAKKSFVFKVDERKKSKLSTKLPKIATKSKALKKSSKVQKNSAFRASTKNSKKKLKTRNKLSAIEKDVEDKPVKEYSPTHERDYDKLWYKEQKEYWSKQPATNDGVLGGYGELNEPESITSKEMI